LRVHGFLKGGHGFINCGATDLCVGGLTNLSVGKHTDLSGKHLLISPSLYTRSQNTGITPLIEINKTAPEDLKARRGGYRG